jgi:transposase
MTTPKKAAPTDAIESTETTVRPITSWTAAERLALLEEYDSYPQGDPRRGGLLRQHGLYSSQLARWREQRKRGTLTPQAVPSTGRPALPRDPQQEEIARLTREVARLQAQLQRAETIIDVQKKRSTLLGLPPTALPNDAP